MQLDISQLEANAGQAEGFLKLLANRNRLMVLCALMDSELSVGELNQRVPLSQSALSQHLATLRSAQAVATRRVSQTIYYRLADDRISQLLTALYPIFCKAT